MHRKRSGLSQSDVAFLVGGICGSSVTRHETVRRLPIVDKALCYEVLFGVSISDLYVGLHKRMRRRIAQRAKGLYRKLEKSPASERREQKMDFLRRFLEEDGNARTE